MSVPPDIEAALTTVADEYGVTVVAARDLGSRAWNLADPESDYDVAIVFSQPLPAYATLDEYLPSLESDYSDDVEISGWNVKRFGELLVDSNPTALEFLHSPRRYRVHDALARLATDVGDEFEPIRLYHHYRSLATTQYRKYIQRRLLDGNEPVYVIVNETEDEYVVRPVDAGKDWTESEGYERLEKPVPYREATTDRTVKRNLYVVRAALFARYIRDTHEFPPMDFLAFLRQAAAEDRFDQDTIRAARRLARRKRAGDSDAVVGDEAGSALTDLPAHIDPAEHAVRGIEHEHVNQFIRSIVSSE